MRRASRGVPVILALLLAGCGPDWQPSWNTASRPGVPGDSLTIRRVTGQEAEFTPLRSEGVRQLRLSAGELRTSQPGGPEAAMTAVPDYRPVPRPQIEGDITPMPRRPPLGSSTPPEPVRPLPPADPPRRVTAPALPPVERVEGTPIEIPGQPTGVVSGGTGRVQSLGIPGSPAGGVAVRDGGTTTVIQPGGRVTTVPSPR